MNTNARRDYAIKIAEYVRKHKRIITDDVCKMFFIQSHYARYVMRETVKMHPAEFILGRNGLTHVPRGDDAIR